MEKMSIEFVIVCGDGKRFELDEATASIFGELDYRLDIIRMMPQVEHRRRCWNLLDDPSLSPIPSEFVEMVIRYCHRHAHAAAADDLDSFDAQFITTEDPLELAKLAKAALRFRISSLFELAARPLTRNANTKEGFQACCDIWDSVPF